MKKQFINRFILILSLCLLPIGLMGKDSKEATLYPAKINQVKGSAYGYINQAGKWIVDPQYEYTSPFSEGYGIVSQEGLYGTVDVKGQQVIPFIYQSLTPYEEERAVVVAKEGMGVINTQGDYVTQKFYNYVQNYADGLAVVGEQVEGSSLYGYINLDGKEIIPPKYQSANDFHKGKALVALAEGTYALIDQKGNKLATYPYPYVYGYNDGYLVYQNEVGGKYGYLDEQGNVILTPQYEWAAPFENGVAVVSTSPYFRGEKGLINPKGQFIYPANYNDILNLGEERVALGKAIDPDEPFKGSIYALADTKGKLLTDFLFYGVSSYESGKASVFDTESTYFINREGEVLTNFPKVPGSGTLTDLGKVIKGEIDYQTLYFNPKGKLIYSPNTIIPLAGEREVLTERYKPTLNHLVYYPSLKGLADETIQERINERLKTQSIPKELSTPESETYTYYSQFTIPFYQKNLLVIDTVASTYYFGAAHPLPSRIVSNIDLQTGTFYTLKDLFKEEADWQQTLNQIVNQMAKESPISEQVYNPQEPIKVGEDQGFTVDADSLYLYYSPYEIGPYSSGYITFKIPYERIMPIINQEGVFWKSYQA